MRRLDEGVFQYGLEQRLGVDNEDTVFDRVVIAETDALDVNVAHF
jgi:hypothetical protein